MNITNRNNRPIALVEAIKRINAEYDYEDADNKISVTSLIGPPRIRMFKKLYKDKIDVDVDDSVYMLFGSAIHSVLDASGSKAIKEVRLEVPFPHKGEVYVVSGKFDHYDPETGVLSDWKFTTGNQSWEVKWEYEAQLNLLAYLMYLKLGITATKLQLNLIFRDWKVKHRKYPRHGIPTDPIMVMDVKKWPHAEILDYIHRQLDKHFSISDIPMCTEKERWREPTVYAVMKPDADKAVRNGLKDTLEEAQEFAKTLKYPTIIDIREGYDKNCVDYCVVKNYCDYYINTYLKNKKDELWD